MQIQKHYTFEHKVLGAGNFGKVMLATSSKDPLFRVAVKIMNKKQIEDMDEVKEEIAVIAGLDHPNICKYYEVYESPKYIFIVMEYIQGTSIFDQFTSTQKYSEKQAASLMQKLFLAVNHCHAHGIAHRDLKPDNVIFCRETQEVKLIDFGLSKRAGKRSLDTIVGTPYYVAPEVLKGDYSVSCDNWSLGVILYLFLSGHLPFKGHNAAEVFSQIKSKEIKFNHKEFNSISYPAKNLISRLLEKDPKKRITMTEALDHPWITNLNKHEHHEIDRSVLTRLAEYKETDRFKKEALGIMAKMMDNKEINQLRNQFLELDLDHTGLISITELMGAMQKAGHPIPQEEAEQIIANINTSGSGKIEYSEFLAATIRLQEVLTHNKLLALFAHFDVDSDGYISEGDLKHAFEGAGKGVGSHGIREMISSHHSTVSGKMTFGDFQAMMLAK